MIYHVLYIHPNGGWPWDFWLPSTVSWDSRISTPTTPTFATLGLNEAKMTCDFRHGAKSLSTLGEPEPWRSTEQQSPHRGTPSPNFFLALPEVVSHNEKTEHATEYERQVSNSHLVYLIQLHSHPIECWRLHWPHAPGIWIWSQISGRTITPLRHAGILDSWWDLWKKNLQLAKLTFWFRNGCQSDFNGLDAIRHCKPQHTNTQTNPGNK